MTSVHKLRDRSIQITQPDLAVYQRVKSVSKLQLTFAAAERRANTRCPASLVTNAIAHARISHNSFLHDCSRTFSLNSDYSSSILHAILGSKHRQNPVHHKGKVCHQYMPHGMGHNSSCIRVPHGRSTADLVSHEKATAGVSYACMPEMHAHSSNHRHATQQHLSANMVAWSNHTLQASPVNVSRRCAGIPLQHGPCHERLLF